MTQVYFHCSNARGVRVERCGAAVDNLTEARDHAARMMQSFIALHGPEDWRDWVMHVSDDLDEEIFALPFSSMLGKPH